MEGLAHGLVFLFAASAACAACDASEARGPREARGAATSPLEAAPMLAVDRSALASFPAETRARIARAPMPVLALNEAALATEALVLEAAFYAHSAKGRGVSVVVQGTHVTRRVPGIEATPGDRRVRGTMGFVTENEGIRSATFLENGVAYAVDVECEERDDARCTGDAFVLAIAESLAYVGGAAR